MKRNEHLHMLRHIKPILKSSINLVRSAGKQKIFCIGKNKTGTTSLAKALENLGIIVAEQRPAELLIQDWSRRDFRRIIRFCHTAQAFQDIPFSLPYTFQIMDVTFPDSKFILSIRDTPDQWYHSLTNYHSKLFSNGKITNYNDLKRATYVYPGWMLETIQSIYFTPDNDLYNKEILIYHYNLHNQTVIEYFHHRPNDLLVINLAEKDAYAKFCDFIGKPCIKEEFPWENQTRKIKL